MEKKIVKQKIGTEMQDIVPREPKFSEREAKEPVLRHTKKRGRDGCKNTQCHGKSGVRVLWGTIRGEPIQRV